LSTLDVNGTTLFVQEHGEGENIVFIHGDLSDARVWENQLKSFGSDYHAVAYSRRYHYPNTQISPGADNPMQPHVEDLCALLDLLEIDRVHLVGDSWGAFIALLFAIQHPRRVKTLVLAEPPVIPLLDVSTPPRPAQIMHLFIRGFRDGIAFVRFAATVFGPAAAAFRRGNLEEGTRRFARGVLGPQVYDRLPESRLQQARENAKPLAAALLGAGFPPLDNADVAAVSAPTLLLRGEHTPSLFRALVERLGDLLPNRETVTIPDATHSAHEQNPGFYNTTVREFLARHAE
jgi:pimeloyl-ACP methyl ester carboxylesterase